jgi:hypothetical protein
MRCARPRLALLTPIALLGALAGPAGAGAHVHTGRVAIDYRANVSPLRPPLAGAVVVRIYESDLAIGLMVGGHRQVSVLGYAGEPLLRIGTKGVEVNESSPTAAGMGLLDGAPEAGASAPEWRVESSGRSFVWHDARVRGLPLGLERGHWTVPLVVDGRTTRVEGEIWRVGAPSLWPWVALGAVFLAVTALLLASRRKPLLRAATLGLGTLTAAATISAEAGFALERSASTGTWLEGVNVLVFTIVGLVFVVLGSRDVRALAGGALGLLGLSVGLTKLPVLLHGVALSALPDLAARAAVVLAIAAGAAAAVVGLAVFFDVLEHYEGGAIRSGRSNAT